MSAMRGPSQWNPCRSRGARSKAAAAKGKGKVSVEPLPKQGCEENFHAKVDAALSLSGTPAEAGVRVDFSFNIF